MNVLNDLSKGDADTSEGGRRRLPTLPQPRSSPRSSFSGPSGGGLGNFLLDISKFQFIYIIPKI